MIFILPVIGFSFIYTFTYIVLMGFVQWEAMFSLFYFFGLKYVFLSVPLVFVII